MYGCPYEVFWHLNPKKLEPFREKYRLEQKARAKEIDNLAWLIGTYTMDAFGAFWGKGKKFPDTPRTEQVSERMAIPRSDGDGKEKGSVMTDGARFYAWVVAHNKNKKERNKN